MSVSSLAYRLPSYHPRFVVEVSDKASYYPETLPPGVSESER